MVGQRPARRVLEVGAPLGQLKAQTNRSSDTELHRAKAGPIFMV